MALNLNDDFFGRDTGTDLSQHPATIPPVLATDPETIMALLKSAGFDCQWDMESSSPRLRIELPGESPLTDAPLAVFLLEDTGQNAFWRRGNSAVFYKSSQISLWHQRQLQHLVRILHQPLLFLLDWRNVGSREAQPGFVRLRPGKGDDPFGSWILLIPSPCEQTCIFCNRSFGYRLDQEKALRPTPEQVEFLSFSAKKNNLGRGTRIIVGGHEPLTLPGLEEIFATLAAHHCQPFRLQTAGWPVTPKLVQKLAEHGLKEVDIPLYSHLSQMHDQIVAREGAFQKTREGLACFREQGIRLISHTVLLPQNLPHLNELVNLALELGFDEFTLRFPTEVPSPNWQGRKLTPSLNTVRHVLAELPAQFLTGGFLRATLPPCTLPPGWENRFFAAEPSPEQVFPPACAPCTQRPRCPGLGASYTSLHDKNTIQPMT